MWTEARGFDMIHETHCASARRNTRKGQGDGRVGNILDTDLKKMPSESESKQDFSGFKNNLPTSRPFSKVTDWSVELLN